ncbi:potassium channel family protein [Brevundimonas sp. Root1279]|uniref:potassium channel family protein n=1 Tax=Brevundimonas sp. Root1279 TaxID=1736443 RepID=UPI0009E97EFE|nr:potassium channel family protein [Brevundimonas sp. Root1279]
MSPARSPETPKSPVTVKAAKVRARKAADAGTPGAPKAEGLRLRARLRYLYHGTSPLAVRFRLAVIAVDFAIIAFFLAAPILQQAGVVFYVIDYVIALILVLDLAGRALAHTDIRDWLKKPATWVDLFILGTLLFPNQLGNFGFLRLLRLWTLLNSDFFWRTVGRKWDDTRVEEITRALAALVTFIFVVTGFVYATFRGRHEGISGYLDALYFTVATLTTTGFGDITLPGNWGRVLSIVVMLTGITLFLRLASTLFRPHKVRFPCPTCGLQKHDPDAVHCKACGEVLCIPDEGD